MGWWSSFTGVFKKGYHKTEKGVKKGYHETEKGLKKGYKKTKKGLKDLGK